MLPKNILLKISRMKNFLLDDTRVSLYTRYYLSGRRSKMPKYLVTVAVTGTVYYEVEADSEQDAWENWYDGEEINEFEGDAYDPVDVEEVTN